MKVIKTDALGGLVIKFSKREIKTLETIMFEFEQNSAQNSMLQKELRFIAAFEGTLMRFLLEQEKYKEEKPKKTT